MFFLINQFQKKLEVVDFKGIFNFQESILDTAQKIKFFIKDFTSKCEQICSILMICSCLLK